MSPASSPPPASATLPSPPCQGDRDLYAGVLLGLALAVPSDLPNTLKITLINTPMYFGHPCDTKVKVLLGRALAVLLLSNLVTQ